MPGARTVAAPCANTRGDTTSIFTITTILSIRLFAIAPHPDLEVYYAVREPIGELAHHCDSVPRERESCIVGTWKNVESNSGDALRRQPSVAEVRYPAPTYSFGADGRYSYNNPFYMHKDLDAPSGHHMYQITYYALNANYGYWGSASSTLAICEQQEVTRGTQTTGFDGQQAPIPLDHDKPISPIRDTKFNFRCVGEDRLELRNTSMGPAIMILKRTTGSSAP